MVILLVEVADRSGEERLEPVASLFRGQLLPADPLRRLRQAGRHELDGAHTADCRRGDDAGRLEHADVLSSTPRRARPIRHP
jgi:hypothetical protein